MDDFREFTTPEGPLAVRRGAVAAVRPVEQAHRTGWSRQEMQTYIYFSAACFPVAEEYEDVRNWAFPKNAQD